MKTSRELAVRALMRVSDGEKSNEVIDDILQKNSLPDGRDRALFTRLVLETLQNRLLLDHCIDEVSTVRVEKMKPFIRELLRVSACQLAFFDSIPASAVCNEAVGLARKNRFGQLSGFVNAVCRTLSVRICQMVEQTEDPALRHSIPAWIAEELGRRLPKEAAGTVMAAFAAGHAPLTARMNLSRAPQDEILEKLEAQGIRAERAPYAANAWYLTGHGVPAQIRVFQEGLLQFQDLTSILASEALDLQSGEKVLDLCAAPGGKSMAAADLVGEHGFVVSCDKSGEKLARIRENAGRCGFSQVQPFLNDATVFRREWEGAFDAVIADLPCSGLGTMGHKPEVRYRVTPDDVDSLAGLQRAMLAQAVRYVRPGGRLLFSTCTFAQKENEGNREYLLSLGELEPLVPAIAPAGSGCCDIQLLPGLFRVHDGFYISCYRRV